MRIQAKTRRTRKEFAYSDPHQNSQGGAERYFSNCYVHGDEHAIVFAPPVSAEGHFSLTRFVVLGASARMAPKSASVDPVRSLRFAGVSSDFSLPRAVALVSLRSSERLFAAEAATRAMTHNTVRPQNSRQPE